MCNLLTMLSSINFNMSNSFKVEKLSGQANYEFWTNQMMAILITKYPYDAIHNSNNEPIEPPIPVGLDRKAKAYIMLSCEKGPSTQIQNCTTAKDCWGTLAKLYSPKWFTAGFLLLKEFFESHLSNWAKSNILTSIWAQKASNCLNK